MRGVQKRFGDHPVLLGADLDVHVGEVLGIRGPSGSGKSTVARIAMGLVARDAGSVSVLGVDPATARRPPPGAQILFQDATGSLNPGLTVRQALAESARVHGGGRAAVIDEALERVSLAAQADALPEELSGGERRRVTLATLWIARPRIAIADEPTAGLDASLKAECLDLLLSRHDATTAVVIISHDARVLRYAADRVVEVRDGKVTA
jgi:peptide/nickel transport system ATP-binding protein